MNKIKVFGVIVCIVAILFSFQINSFAKESMKITTTNIDQSIRTEQAVKLSIAGNNGLVGFKLHFEYNPEEIEIISTSAGEVTSRGNFIDNIGSKKGKFDILWNNTANVSKDGTIAIIKLKLLKETDATIKVTYSQNDTCSYSEKTGQFENVVFNCDDIVTNDRSAGEKLEQEENKEKIGTLQNGTDKSEINSKTKEEQQDNKNSLIDSNSKGKTDMKEKILENTDVTESVKKELKANATIDETQVGKPSVNATNEKNSANKMIIIFVVIIVITALVTILFIEKGQKKNRKGAE